MLLILEDFSMWLIIIFTILFILFLIPIKIKINVLYQDKKLNIFFFNKNLSLKDKKIHQAKEKGKKNKFIRDLQSSLPKCIPSILIDLDRNFIKPKMKFEFILDYGTDDAASTALCYGLMQSISPLLYKSISIIFNIKKYDFIITPHFNEYLLNFRITSIISVNLVKLIYMLIRILCTIRRCRSRTNSSG
jgi:hypothetical protein